MKIDSSGPVRPSTTVRRSERASGARGSEFTRHLDAPVASASVSGGSPLSAVDALLALQEVDDATAGPAKTKQRGDDILDRLDDLRHGLLNGFISRQSLTALATMVRARRERATDPRLQEILGEIELRAEVELAKYEASGGNEGSAR
ncbi:MAG: flagellar assembly protein FliX [Rhodospirillales bacterium]|nr:flagellar assembly protein FliX [Rhodospirillales bacterium]